MKLYVSIPVNSRDSHSTGLERPKFCIVTRLARWFHIVDSMDCTLSGCNFATFIQ